MSVTIHFLYSKSNFFLTLGLIFNPFQISNFDRTRTGNKYFNVTLDMPFLPTDQYRRQAIRSRLDVVVSMGGMLGLFLGASILSAIEFIYYFTMRPLNNMLRERSATERTNQVQLQGREHSNQKYM